MREPGKRYYRMMFYSAAAFNLFAGLVMLAAFDEMYQFAGGPAVPEAPVFDLFLHLVSALVLLFSGVYYWLGRDPSWYAGRPVALVSCWENYCFSQSSQLMHWRGLRRCHWQGCSLSISFMRCCFWCICDLIQSSVSRVLKCDPIVFFHYVEVSI